MKGLACISGLGAKREKRSPLSMSRKGTGVPREVGDGRDATGRPGKGGV